MEVGVRELRNICAWLKFYIDPKNDNYAQQNVRVKSNSSGQVVFISSNGHAICSIKFPVSGPPNIDYCIDWNALLSLSKTTMLTMTMDFTILKTCIKIKVNGSRTKLEASPSTGFDSDIELHKNIIKCYKGDYDAASIKSLKHSVIVDIQDPIIGMVSLNKGYAYTCRHYSICKTPFKLFTNKQKNKPIYLRYQDFRALTHTTNAQFFVGDNAVIAKHSLGLLTMPIVNPDIDLVGTLEKAYASSNVKHKVKINKKYFVAALHRTRQIVGAVNVRLHINSKKISIKVEDESVTDDHWEFINCKSDIECSCLTKVTWLLEFARAVVDTEFEILIPDLTTPASFLCLGDSKITDLIAFRNNGQLEKVET